MRDIGFETVRILENRSLIYNVSGVYLAVKRLFDIIGALLLILLLFPLFALIYLFIRIVYGKPVLIGEERRGYRGNVFKMHKFRSITANGNLIKNAGLDMLPALINVIKGDLSLVGPWPPTVFETLSYEPKHVLRLSAKPGITGLWRIYRTDRGNVDEMTKVDLKYIRERSIRVDLFIFLKTIFLIVRPSKKAWKKECVRL
ncbi:MAG: sugar transferase [Acetivibrionales bacterium]|jgi:lipopolysaccharide/colanic/teichoic acid biosynthesis glycosyltransferase